jgi:RHH-type proline utilization regulon transcriptional repressor/proline dehydrogenase/delta 1-pyrroline-5-carboxylate dehydrogenase
MMRTFRATGAWTHHIPTTAMTTAFAAFAPRPADTSPLRAAITAATRVPEPVALAPLLEQARLPQDKDQATQALALRIAGTLRQRKASAGRAGIVQGLLQEFALSSQEGVALMCLAEALLRIPDAATRDALIRDKISNGQWEHHLGKSPSLFVNAATWGLLLTGKLTATHSEGSLSASLGRLIGKGGEPLIRKGVDMAMRMMGEQFVTGETIADALSNARTMEAEGFRYSYDMLGEAALTSEDAARYYQSYEQAIHAIGKASNGRGIYEGPGISIKLSALHPRYSRAQWQRVMDELFPRVLRLAELARQYDIGLNIDAEETERLETSLDLLERLCHAPSLQGWNGIGFVIQAYQKRCPFVIDFCVDLARRTQRRLMVRLVKGAYWDSEIKRAQVDGLADYPVYTRKVHTDVSYLACARKLLAAPEAIYPQFATHNAHTLAAIYHMAGHNYYAGQYEFQCLHGMGEPLYEQVVGAVTAGKLGRPCRIYAPVGTHETLLAYLVRRLLENGANTSFVNRIADPAVALEDLVQNPVAAVLQAAQMEGAAGLPHPRIPQPVRLYGSERNNSQGLDLANEQVLTDLSTTLRQSALQPWHAGPLLAQDTAPGTTQPVRNPADHQDVVGQVQETTLAEADQALAWASEAAAPWAATAPAERANALLRAADLLEAQKPQLLGLLMREAGKTCANGVAEVREAVDFLRYYAAQVKADFHNDTHLPLGPVVCISPWNFPLAIFVGQVAAALAAGNTVLAKPAEQTPLIAAQAVRALWQAGVPRAAVQLLPGQGETVGARLVGDARTMGVVFTGSTEVARILQRTLAGRLDARGNPVTLIAETGGQNAMVVDSSALAEQVVGDAVASAFDSAGQRCSALRVLCVQEEAADRIVAMLQGAMAELRLGRPDALRVDVGPVIDREAQAGILAHIEALRTKGNRVFQADEHRPSDAGTFVPPTLIEIDSLAQLQREVFGPVLHVVRYARKDLARLMQQIAATGYGLTLGLHTRIDETIAQVLALAHAGNIYVNRNMVGAVVGVQPFGGEGLSGTGPKAGGPLYLLRMLSRHPEGALALSLRGAQSQGPAPAALTALQAWASQRHTACASACERMARLSPAHITQALPGPTGESNTYSILPRARVLCLASSDADRLTQLAAVLAAGGQALWPAECEALHQQLPEAVQEHVSLVAQWQAESVWFDAVLHHGDADALRAVCQAVAQRPGPIVGVTGLPTGATDVPLERLVHERSVSVNTAAAGGNASLMTIG